MYCVATPNLFATSFSHPSTFGVCRDIIFLVETNIFLFSRSTLSRQDFFESLAISVAIGNSLVAIDFSSLILFTCLAVCHDIEIFVATCLTWLISVLLLFLSQPNFILSRQRFFLHFFTMLQHEFLCRHCFCVSLQLLVTTENSPPSCFVCCDRNNLCRDRDFVALSCEF